MARKRVERPDRTVEMVPDLKFVFAPKNEEQKQMLKVISESTISLITGCPGSGKTFVPVCYAMSRLLAKRYDHIIFTRPIIEAVGEKIGYLPGETDLKVRPYFTHLFAIVSQLVDQDTFKQLTIKNGQPSKIQVVPLSFMRGLTFHKSLVIADEFQNATIEQVRLLLTRIGEGSKMIISGDLNQSDIYPQVNGLEDAIQTLADVNGVKHFNLSEEAIVRHPIIMDIERKYNARRNNLRKDSYP